jgi:hypothetical protein
MVPGNTPWSGKGTCGELFHKPGDGEMALKYCLCPLEYLKSGEWVLQQS